MVSKKFDLIFMHLLVPHKPYGFNSKCGYDTRLSNLNLFFTKEEHIEQHYREKCVIKFMDSLNLLQSLSNYRIISDHGSRIKQNISSLSTLAFKDYKNNFI